MRAVLALVAIALCASVCHAEPDKLPAPFDKAPSTAEEMLTVYAALSFFRAFTNDLTSCVPEGFERSPYSTKS